MGNENSSAEGPVTAYTESQTGERRDSKPENGSVLTEPLSAQPEQDILRTSEEEERRKEEENEELLFTDDLLPNIDLSAELNLWRSSFRAVEPLPSPQADIEFRTPTEEVAPPLVHQSTDQLENRSSLTEAEECDPAPVTPPSPEDHTSQPSLPAHLSRDSAQFPTPPPTPPERCLPTPPPSDSPEPQTPTPAPPIPDLPPDSPTLQPKDPTDTPSAPSQDVPHRFILFL
ncbi:hypothetical protein SKAU_G00413640 [Synaphobranchus kaupii]|uniref:Uncharacterized protein n=1 Tax=Synaphobranchus kaupii TaxID=118154 RepID=A0A9Q1E899_SYNKA|nr:hypothetical protein SKAU_G00413640 [Synaphobranchus kaupii]